MADEPMVVLRQAWFGDDGAAMVAAVESVGLTTCLQWAGDLVRGAIGLDASRAGALAERACAALRDRGWDGDDELADAIDDVRSGRVGALPELPVDLEELAMLLDGGGPDAAGGRIDLSTGAVWPASALEDSLPDSDCEFEDERRWLGVWPEGSRAGYRDMADFAASRTEELHRLLEVALHGRGAFRRFKDVLFDWPGDRQEWFAFSEDRSRGRARAWLADAGYRPAARPRADE